MEVYFNPTYVVPIDAPNPFPVIIDIDGDASEIVDPGPVTGGGSSFRLEVNLSEVGNKYVSFLNFSNVSLRSLMLFLPT